MKPSKPEAGDSSTINFSNHSMNLHHQQQSESALRALESLGFDVKPLWRELSDRIARAESGTPDADDLRYTIRGIPPTTEEHFVDGKPQVLDPYVLWSGFSYTLTPGQRSLLRDTYGMTPTQTVTVASVETWPGTLHPRTMKLVSDLHVDPRHRTKVLTSCIIRNVGEFFRKAEETDAATEAEKVFGVTEGTLELGRLFTLTSHEKWAIDDLTSVKIGTRVEITGVGSETFIVLDLKSGAQAKVPRKEFFETVAEYDRLYKDKVVTRKSNPRKAPDITPAIAELAKSLGIAL